MPTIGELERLAGIEQTPEARTAFWKPFAHLSASEMLQDGCTLLNALAAQRQAADRSGLSVEQMAELRSIADKNGRIWKSRLRDQWMKASAPPVLHGLRNTHGPSWLADFRFP